MYKFAFSIFFVKILFMWQADTYLITYLMIILSTLMDHEQELSINELFYYLRFWRLSKQSENHSQALTKSKSALTWKSTNANYPTSIILIFNCDKSPCEAFLLSIPRISSSHETINFIISSIFTQCISGHSNIPSNESTNRAAKEAPLSTL